MLVGLDQCDTLGVTLNNVTPLDIVLLDVNFDKSTLGLHFLLIHLCFQDD